jgi:GTP cyclohydrolase II
MNSLPSRTILEVERAVCDLRRGVPVLLRTEDGLWQVSAGEYLPRQKATSDAAHPAVQLMKYAGLLPFAVVEKAASDDSLLTVSAAAIAAYRPALAASLERVSEAQIPLHGAQGHEADARVIAFRPRFGHEEHLAVLIGDVKAQPAPLLRMHSSCITGDVLGSLRCDCGNQLSKALDIIMEQGAGALLYLNQEGRGIGIASKLRAYGLQDTGMDTVEANEHLGYSADERDFGVAAEMLRQLELTTVTLITNNPQKIAALTARGIIVAGREPLITATNVHNARYLGTKATKLGHRLEEGK